MGVFKWLKKLLEISILLHFKITTKETSTFQFPFISFIFYTKLDPTTQFFVHMIVGDY